MSARRQLTASGQQTGVALVTAMLMVAIATTLAIKLVWDNQLNMRRTEATLNMEQARQLGLTTEAVAIALLLDYGAEEGSNAQDLDEIGVIQTEAMVEEESLGLITAQLFDIQGRMNVNDLVSRSGVDEKAKDRFIRLMQSLSLDIALVDALVDWIDPDSVPNGLGAEDGDYSGLDPAYRAANNYLTDISELRAIRGFDEETYATLLPHVTAIPVGWCGANGNLKVNFNFATAEVMAAVTGMSPGDAESLVSERDETPWEAFGDIPLPLTIEADDTDIVGVDTLCFRLSVTIIVGSSTLTMYSLIDRSTPTEIVARARGYGLEY